MILVSVPYFGTPWLIRRAVDLLLAQTYPHLTVVVTNDADRHTPWPHLDDVTDPRLVRFDIPKNRGRYYCDQVALTANPHELFSVHDSDDWSESTRFAGMVEALGEADAVSDGWIRHGLNDQIEKYHPKPELTGYRSGRSLWHFAHHKGIWQTDRLRLLGCGPQFRVGWDTYLMHFAAKTLNMKWTREYGYHQQRRKGSLTQAGLTGITSKHRTETVKALDELWGRLLAAPADVADICTPAPELAARIEEDAARLRELL